MTADILLVLVLLVAAMVLFMVEWLSVDAVTLLLVIALVGTGLLTPAQAFAGFANEIIIILASVFVLSGALVKTGVMERLGEAIRRLSGRSEARILGWVMPLAALLSAFFSNTSATAILMPAVIGSARKSRLSPSRLLMPLAYASILGGTCTLIGTSTNMAASGLMANRGLHPFGLFEFSPVGLVLAGTGILYLLLVGRHFLPRRRTDSVSGDYDIQAYLSEVTLPEGSAFVGKSLYELDLPGMEITVLAIDRAGQKVRPKPRRVLEGDDTLLVQATQAGLLEAQKNRDLAILADRTVGDPELAAAQLGMAEAVVMPQSSLLGKTVRQIRFRRRYGVSVLAIHRRGHAHPTRLADFRLAAGDVLLLQGSSEQFQDLQGNPDLWGLTELPSSILLPRRYGLFALGALVTAVALSTFGILPLSISFLAAALAVVLARCITMDEAYGFIQWRLLVLIAGMTALGTALETTGAADGAARLIIEWVAPWGLWATMVTLAILTLLLTQPMSNAAAVLLVLPVALSTAAQLGVNPRSFAALVTLSGSLSFIAPLEPACLLVYGPGAYRFRDFVVAGLPLTALVVTLLVLLVPVFWPL